MTEAVLDASVVAKWFHTDGERHVAQARSLRDSFESGELVVFAPPLLRLEIFNIAGRRWKWTEEALVTLAVTFDAIDFVWTEPELAGLSSWVARGLTAYDACYAAVAESKEIQLVTDDRRLLEIANTLAVPIA